MSTKKNKMNADAKVLWKTRRIINRAAFDLTLIEAHLPSIARGAHKDIEEVMNRLNHIDDQLLQILKGL